MRRRIYTLLCALTLSLCVSTTFAADRFLSGLQKMDGITSVYVGKAMLKLVGDNLDSKMFFATGMDNVSHLLKDIDCVDVVTAETKKSADYLRSLVDSSLKKMPQLELALETEEDGEYTRIYVQPSSDGQSYKRIVVINSEPDEITVVDLQGEIEAEIADQFNF